MGGKERRLPVYSQLVRRARAERGQHVLVIVKELGVSESAYRNAENGRGGPTVIERIGRVFPEIASEIQEAFAAETASSAPDQVDRFSAEDLLLPVPLLRGLAEARVTRFHPSRKYYKLLRDGKSTISDYVGQATERLEMVSINLATGMELERVIDTFERLIWEKKVVVRVSLLDPEKDYLMKAIAPVLGSSDSVLGGRIQDTMDTLARFRQERLPRQSRNRFELWAHRCIPNASAIILDGDSETGLVQLETKGFQMGMDKSFGFEVAAPSEFFTDLRNSYRDLIADGRKIL